jgi:hypothetical protein
MNSQAGLPDPPGFPEDLLKRREEERQFLTQLARREQGRKIRVTSSDQG